MAGGVLKGFGITSIVLGILLLLAGIVAVAVGYSMEEENDDRLLGSGDEEDQAEAAMLGGAAAFAAGLVVLVLGVILNAAGNGRRHRELVQLAARPGAPETAASAAPAAAKAAAPAPGRPQRGWAIAGVALAIVLAVLGGAVALASEGGRPNGLLNGGGAPVEDQEFDGAVRNAASLPLAGAYTADDSGSLQEFTAPAEARSLEAVLEWTPAAQGTDELVLILERHGPDGWTEVGRTDGAGPLSLRSPVDGGATLRSRVFPGGDGDAVVDQPFHVRLDFS